MITYQDVAKLAQDKGYDSILAMFARYGGDAMLPHEVTGDAMRLCELTLIQQHLIEKHKTIPLVGRWATGHYNFLVVKPDGTIFKDSTAYGSYQNALLHAINKALKLLP